MPAGRFLPELFGDIELIHILPAEAIQFTRIEEKVEALSELIFDIIKDNLIQGELTLTRKSMHTALVTCFPGIFNAVRITKSASICTTTRDTPDFVKQTIGASLHLSF